jgi:NHL repeat-containing protein
MSGINSDIILIILNKIINFLFIKNGGNLYMFPNDLFVIDAYKAKVLKISNDVSSEIFDLEKEVGIVNPKDTTPKEENPVETITGHGKKDPFAGKPGYSSITVSQDKVSLFITNRNNGYLYHYKKNVGEGKYTLFQKVKVGKQPVACCEDPNGNIYVANYGDNTVSKVEIPSYKNTSATENEDLQDKVVKNIAVAAGPKSIVSDEEGTIWVACYLSHKIDPKTGADLGGIVNKIVNTTVVDSINVGSNPAAITCDTSNTIWVANSGSNTVSRILKSKKVVDFEVGARPVALVNDSYGNVIVTNYDGNTVTIIETSSKAIKEGNNITTIPVGKGPNAIDVNMDDDVYVVCGLENTIHKISGKQVVSVVEVCDSPVAFGDFSGCANYNAQNVMAKADKGTTEEKIQTALDKAKQSEDSVKEMSARVEHALEDVKTAKQAVEAKTEQITEAVTKAGNAEQKATANAESIEAIKTGKLETTVFESYKSATVEKIDAATQKATTNEENIGQIKTNKLDVSVFESYKTEADGKFATKAELAAAGTSGSGAGTGTASLTPADQAKINKIDGIETDVTSIKAVTDGLKDKTFVEDSVFTAYKSEAEGKFATKDEITTSGTGNLSVADKAKINKIDDIETAANAAKAVTDTIKDKTFVEDSAFNAYKSEVETKYATKAEVTTAGTGLSSDDQAKIAKIDGIETKADDAKAVTDTLKGKTFVEESAFNTYKSDADGKFATKAELTSASLSSEDQAKIAKIDTVEATANAAKAVTDTLKDKTFVEESALDAKFTEKLQPVTQDVTSKYNELKQSIESVSTAGLPENVKQDIQSAKDAAAKLNEFESKVTEAKNAADSINAVKADVAAAKAVTDSIKDKTFVEESAFDTYKSDADSKFATKASLTEVKNVTDGLKDKTFVEDATFTAYKSEAEGKFATKAEVTAAGTGLSSDDQAKIAKIDAIETKADDAKSVTDTLKGKTFVEDSAFTAYKDNVYKNYANKQYTESAMRAFQHDLQSYQEADKETKKTLQEMKAVTDSVKDKTFVEDSTFTSYKSEAEGKFATKEEVGAAGTGLSSDDQAKIAKIDGIETTANAAKAVTDTLNGKTFVEKSTYDAFETEAREKFKKVTDLETGMSALNRRNLIERGDLDSFKTEINNAYAQKSELNDLSNRLNDYATQNYVELSINSAKGDLATKAEVQAIHGLTEDDQTKLAKLDTINKEVDILNKLDALHINILKLEPNSDANTNTVYFEFDEVVNPISLPEDFDLSNGNILNSNDASSHPLKFVSLDGSKTETCSVGTFNDSVCFKLTYSTITSTSFPLGDSSFVAKAILPYNPSSTTEGVQYSVFKEVEFYIRTIDDNTLREKVKSDKIQMYVASGLFPVVNRTDSTGTYEQYNGDYIPSSTKVNAESLLEFDDFMSTSKIGIKRKNFENAIDIVDQDAAITIPLNIKETSNLRGRIPHNDFNTLFFILPKELTNGVESINVFMDYQRQIVHKYPEEKITKEAYKKYDVYYFISNTNITENLYLNIVL